MTLHKLDLRPLPFQAIKNKNKIYELRLYDERRRNILPGDELEFTNTITQEKLCVRVVSLHIYNNFEELYQSISPRFLGYEKDEIASASDMEQYYPKARQNAYKVVAIKISLKD